MGGRSAAAVLAAILSVTLVADGAGQEPAAAASDTVPTGPEVESVRFPGATALEPDRIQAAIETRPSECRSPLYILFCVIGDWDWAEEKSYLDPAVLPEDEERIEVLYEIWGYPDARVESRVVEEADGDVVVEFRVVEGEPIRVVALEIVGLDRLDPPVELLMPLPLRVGQPYALPRLEATEERIRQAFAERARPYARIEVGGDVDEAERTASIVVEVDPGPAAVFGPVTIQAEPPIEEEVVRERLAWEPGEPYRPSALDATERALYRLPIVERAVADPATTGRRDTVIATTVAVAARERQGFQVEGSVSSTECLEAAAFWNHRYFLGEPRTLSVGVGLSNLLARQADGFPCTDAGDERFAVVNYFVRAELTQPWPGSPRTEVLGSVFAHRESAPNAFVQTGYGARLGVSRLLRPRVTATLLYEPERNELDAAGLFFCGNYGVCSAEGIAELTDFNWLSPVELLVLRAPVGGFGEVRRPPDGLADPWAEDTLPGRRWWHRTGVEAAHVLTGSDFEYARGIGEAAATRRFGARREAAVRGRLGTIVSGEVLP
ncbi:MAG: POTRA domain-containing protein, partial [Gemmatimonadota bacterium]